MNVGDMGEEADEDEDEDKCKGVRVRASPNKRPEGWQSDQSSTNEPPS